MTPLELLRKRDDDCRVAERALNTCDLAHNINGRDVARAALDKADEVKQDTIAMFRELWEQSERDEWGSRIVDGKHLPTEEQLKEFEGLDG